MRDERIWTTRLLVSLHPPDCLTVPEKLLAALMGKSGRGENEIEFP